MGYILVATGLLSARISFFFKLDKKWLSNVPKNYAQILGQVPNLGHLQPITWANINIFQ
jgi:hypothetical protein